MENREEKACLCALNRIFGFAPTVGTELIRHFGSASKVFMSEGKEVERLLGPFSRFKGCVTAQARDEALQELDRLEKSGIRFIGWTESTYPPLLKECEDAPVGLYVRTAGPLESLWAHKKSIAVVGTRDISPYGKEWCTKAVSAIASSKEKPAIISGLALGTDITAHVTALEHGLPTIAVMATGADMVYPHRHRSFAERLVHTPGCALVTDYPPGTAPLAIHFLRRNRIIAGLSHATVLIESKIKGGGMMTCNLAFSYSRDVLALPGRADDIRSQGCNLLIRKRIAEPFFSCKELTDSLGLSPQHSRNSGSFTEMVEKHYRNRSVDTEAIVRTISVIGSQRGVTVEGIALCQGIEYREAALLTGLLEADGFITIDLLQRCSINIRKQQHE